MARTISRKAETIASGKLETEKLEAQPFRYIVVVTSWQRADEELGGVSDVEHETISHHRTKVAALRGWKRAKAEAETWYETDEYFTLLYYIDPETCVTSFFREDDYAVCSVDRMGECQLCQQRERPCYDRYADGRCKRLAYATKGPWRVYALVDPRDGRTRYIGSTEKSLTKRLSGHLCAREGARGAWIDDLLASGLKPAIREITQFGTWLEALTHEYELINSLPALTNEQKTHSAVTRARDRFGR